MPIGRGRVTRGTEGRGGRNAGGRSLSSGQSLGRSKVGIGVHVHVVAVEGGKLNFDCVSLFETSHL